MARPLLTLLVVLSLPAPARAAESPIEARLREALRSTTAQLRAAEDERSRAQATVAAQKKQIADLEAKLAAAAGRSRSSPRADKQVQELARKNDELAAAAARLDGDLRACEAKAAEAGTAVDTKEQERAALAEKLGGLNDRISACEAKNARMIAIAREILGRYQRVGIGAALASKEPFLGLKRVELENLGQDYEDKLREQEVRP